MITYWPARSIFISRRASPVKSRANNSLKKISQDSLGRVHFSFLKWTLGVGKYTSNAAVWGESGRQTLAIEVSEQMYSNHQRLEQFESENSQAFVRHAFVEQRSLNLVGFRTPLVCDPNLNPDQTRKLCPQDKLKKLLGLRLSGPLA